LTAHSPILIDSILDFESWNGSGTGEDPFTISHLQIDSIDETPCIHIEDIGDVYYEIRNCELSGSIYEGSGQNIGIDPVGSAIYIESGHATVIDCTIYNSSIGVSSRGGDIELIDNSINGLRKGIFIGTNNSVIIQNDIIVGQGSCIELGELYQGINTTILSCSFGTTNSIVISAGIYANNATSLRIEECDLGGMLISLGESGEVTDLTIDDCINILTIILAAHCLQPINISNNLIRGRYGEGLGIIGYFGISIASNVMGVHIDSNAIEDCGKGIGTAGDDTTVRINYISNCSIGVSLYVEQHERCRQWSDKYL
jgi:hypothetical protein